MTHTAKMIEIKCKKSKDFIEYTEPLKDSQSISGFARNFYFDDLLIYESFFVILVNSKSMPIGWAKIGQGGICGTTVDIRIIAKYAIDTLARNIFLVHNHPGGSVRPSKEDINLTKTIVEAMKLFDIKVLDHIILTENEYYSFWDNGML